MTDHRPPIDIAEEYFTAIEEGIDEERRDQLESEIEELESQREKFEEIHGENHRLVQRVLEEIGEKEENLSEVQSSETRVLELRKKVLNAVSSSFELDGKWMDPTLIKAINHTLIHNKDDQIVIDQHPVQDSADVADIDLGDRLMLEHDVILLAKDALGETTIVEDRWEKFEDSTAFPVFEIIVANGPVTPEDVNEVIDDDAISKKDCKNWLERPIYTWDDLTPYYRVGSGEFDINLTGQYFATHFGSVSPDSNDEPMDTNGDNGGNDDGGQTTIADVS